MYQNLDSNFSDGIKRSQNVQGRCGTESENCLSFIQYYESLQKNKYKIKIQFWLHKCLYLLLKDSILRPRGSSSILLSTCGRKRTDFCEHGGLSFPQPIL